MRQVRRNTRYFTVVQKARDFWRSFGAVFQSLQPKLQFSSAIAQNDQRNKGIKLMVGAQNLDTILRFRIFSPFFRLLIKNFNRNPRFQFRRRSKFALISSWLQNFQHPSLSHLFFIIYFSPLHFQNSYSEKHSGAYSDSIINSKIFSHPPVSDGRGLRARGALATPPETPWRVSLWHLWKGEAMTLRRH